MKKINFKRIGQIVSALVVFVAIYAGYLFLMSGHWYSLESYTGQFFKEDLAKAPTVTITDVSGGYLSWSRTVKLSNGRTVFFHRDNTPSAWKLKKGQKIAVWISSGDLFKAKSSCFCGAYEKR